MRAGTADTELIRAAVTLASRAPSLHNTQPWLWVAHDDALHLHLDRSRIVRNTDTGGREGIRAAMQPIAAGGVIPLTPSFEDAKGAKSTLLVQAPVQAAPAGGAGGRFQCRRRPSG